MSAEGLATAVRTLDDAELTRWIATTAQMANSAAETYTNVHAPMASIHVLREAALAGLVERLRRRAVQQ